MALPVRFTATDARADHHQRQVELHRERVVLHRAVRGIRMAVNVPVRSFLGIAVRMLPPDTSGIGGVSVSLEHRDPGLSVPLFVAPDTTEAVAEWQLWARVFGLPLLVADLSGNLREPFHRIGAVRVAQAAPRRRRRNAIKARRPTFALRRRPGDWRVTPLVHRNEREIIARN
jgi:hypothetical protein